MIKLLLPILFFCLLPAASFADYLEGHRIMPIESFKDRFTMGELLAISTAYMSDAYIRNAVSKLDGMNSVDLDSEALKKNIGYLTSKEILSENRGREILK